VVTGLQKSEMFFGPRSADSRAAGEFLNRLIANRRTFPISVAPSQLLPTPKPARHPLEQWSSLHNTIVYGYRHVVNYAAYKQPLARGNKIQFGDSIV
jgi:hypothetical protein